MSAVLDRIRGALVGLRMPRALEALDHTMQQLEQGNLSGIENANFVLVPKCSFVETIRIAVLTDLAAADLDFTVADETETYVLFAINRPEE